jgi:hypothetical protein
MEQRRLIADRRKPGPGETIARRAERDTADGKGLSPLAAAERVRLQFGWQAVARAPGASLDQGSVL